MPKIVKDVEARWSKRFGSALEDTRKALSTFVGESDVDLPDGVYSGWVKGDWRLFPPRSSSASPADSLPSLLSQALLRCTIDFESASGSSIAVGATTLRVLSSEGVVMNDLPLLSGLASQMSAAQTRSRISPTTRSGTRIGASVHETGASISTCRDVTEEYAL